MNDKRDITIPNVENLLKAAEGVTEDDVFELYGALFDFPNGSNPLCVGNTLVFPVRKGDSKLYESFGSRRMLVIVPSVTEDEIESFNCVRVELD